MRKGEEAQLPMNSPISIYLPRLADIPMMIVSTLIWKSLRTEWITNEVYLPVKIKVVIEINMSILVNMKKDKSNHAPVAEKEKFLILPAVNVSSVIKRTKRKFKNIMIVL